MKSWVKAIGFGVLVWLIPFIIGFLAFPFREPARPLFESIMAVAVAATAAGVGYLYLSKIARPGFKDGLFVGLLWWVMCVVIDLPLMSSGPMAMSMGQYFADIGLTYVTIPAVTAGLGAAFGSSD